MTPIVVGMSLEKQKHFKDKNYKIEWFDGDSIEIPKLAHQSKTSSSTSVRITNEYPVFSKYMGAYDSIKSIDREPMHTSEEYFYIPISAISYKIFLEGTAHSHMISFLKKVCNEKVFFLTDLQHKKLSKKINLTNYWDYLKNVRFKNSEKRLAQIAAFYDCIANTNYESAFKGLELKKISNIKLKNFIRRYRMNQSIIDSLSCSARFLTDINLYNNYVKEQNAIKKKYSMLPYLRSNWYENNVLLKMINSIK